MYNSVESFEIVYKIIIIETSVSNSFFRQQLHQVEKEYKG